MYVQYYKDLYLDRPLTITFRPCGQWTLIGHRPWSCASHVPKSQRNKMADKEQKDRKAEIERRKKRLEELRRDREQKKKEVKDKEVCL